MGKQKKKGWNKKSCPRCHGTGKMLNNDKNRKRAGGRSVIDGEVMECDLCNGTGARAR